MNTFLQARAALERALTNRQSSFYRNLWRSHGLDPAQLPDDETAWRHLPVIRKADLLKVPMTERLFAPFRDVDTISFTSGTSGTGVLIVPRNLPPPSPKDEMLYYGRRLMSFFYYTYSMAHARSHHMQDIISGDAARMPQSAALAAQADIDALHGPASVLIAFAQHLTNRTRIAHINLDTERLSRLQERLLSELYPRAQKHNVYAMREVGPVARTPAASDGPLVLKPLPQWYIELVTDQGTIPLEHATNLHDGELVLTTLGDSPQPYIRYGTGDLVRAHPQQMGGVYIEMLGRSGEDRVRIPGGEMVLAELERALADVFGSAVADCECTIDESTIGGTLLTRASLRLYTPSTATLPDDATERLARSLRVNPKHTWHEGVARGLYAPLVCEVLPLRTGGKRMRLVDAR